MNSTSQQTVSGYDVNFYIQVLSLLGIVLHGLLTIILSLTQRLKVSKCLTKQFVFNKLFKPQQFYFLQYRDQPTY